MLSVDFEQNYNGKLFLEYFGAVLLEDNERFFPGNELNCVLKGKQMGTVKVVATRIFLFKYISDVLSYIDCAQPAHYLAELVANEARTAGTTLQPDTRLNHVIFSYTKRNLETHSYLLNEWWQDLLKNQKSIVCS